MDWIFDNLQYVVLIAIAAASWFKRRADVKAESEAEEEARREMAEGNLKDIFGDEEPWVPPVAPAPPPPLPPQSGPPPPLRHIAPGPQQRAAESQFEDHDDDVLLKRQREMEERLSEIRHIKEAKIAAPNPRTLASTGTQKPSSHRTSNCYRKALRKRSEIRQAIVMREILGPPVGLQK